MPVGDLWRFSRQTLSAERCSFVSSQVKSLPEMRGVTQGGPNPKLRQSTLRWIPETREWRWLWDHLWWYMREANEAVFGYDMDRLETIQHTRYVEGEYYGWHIDANLEARDMHHRKLSVTMLLVDWSNELGGKLELDCGQQPPLQYAGDLVVFPSLLRHQVTPVVQPKAQRETLVAWSFGPRWR